ncbi:MAG TPA: type VI secretion system baseplate subunit TssF [Vicinamibacterales bacterium]|jgi:type VI secretion system protein ImpG
MDPRLLQYYNIELQHLREMGAEFAEQFPKIAARLGMSGIEVTDPYVERLIEGFGFLAARVHLKLDAEFPRFTQSLLETVYPHYLAPTPSMVVAQCTPDPNEPGLASGVTVPRGSTLQGVSGADDATACEFRTSQDVTLWPIEIVSASYFSYAPDLPLNALPIAQRIKGGVRIVLKTTAGLKFSQISLDRLSVYLTGRSDVANGLFELCLTNPLGALVLPGKGANRRYEFLGSKSFQAIGFSDDEAVLPVTLRSFQGYRLLQEYFAFPQRFRFFELAGLQRALSRIDGSEVELVLLLGRGDPNFESLVDASNLALFCTPAINLFPKRADRIHVTEGTYEYHVVPDRTRAVDFEVYEVTNVVGHGVGSDSEQEFRPFYSAYSSDGDADHTAFFTTRREPRLVSADQRRRGVRSSYIGSEVFIGLVDSAHAPFSGDLRQLSIQTLCTNRDLVLHMPVGIGKSDFALDVAAPVTGIRVIAGPSRPYAPLADGNVAWKAISHLSLNYLSLVNSTPQEGASALRDLLDLYAGSGDVGARKQVDSVRSVRVVPVVRRLPPMLRETASASSAKGSASRLSFGRGLEITVEVDEMAFEGGSAFLLGSVLAQFFSRYVSINSFTETVLRSLGRGEIYRWVPQWGARPTL